MSQRENPGSRSLPTACMIFTFAFVCFRAMPARACALLMAACLTSHECEAGVFTGKHVPIEGKRTPEMKVHLAQQIISGLPEDHVRALVKKRFPNLTDSQLQCIHLRYTEMDIYSDETFEHLTDKEVHLVVEVEETLVPHTTAAAIEEYVASMFRSKLHKKDKVKHS